MNIVKYKKILLIAIIALLSVFVANSLTFLAITLHNKFKDILEETNELTKYFAKGVGTESNPYLITSNDHMDNFFDLMHGGKTFAGEYITLGADISYETKARATALDTEEETGNEAISVFGGIFDGNGCSISAVVQGVSFVRYHVGEELRIIGGIFDGIVPGAQIKNVEVISKIIRCGEEISPPSGFSQSGAFGGIFGVACDEEQAEDLGLAFGSGPSIVSNCKVSGVTFLGGSQKYNEVHVGGIGGYLLHEVRISNCLVENTINRVSSNNTYNTHEGSFVGYGNYVHSITNSVSANAFTSAVNGGGVTYPYDTVYNPSNWTNKLQSVSAIGGPTGSAWYYSSDYGTEKRKNYPLLRTFMNWKKCEITGDHAKVGTSQNPTTNSCTIYIPYDANKTYSASGTNEETLTIYDRTIYSSGNGICHAGNIVWEAASAVKYTVKWFPTKRSVVINKLSNCSTPDYAYNNSKMVLVYCGEIVSATFEDDYINSNAHGTMIISFKNVDGQSISYTFKANDGYYFDSSKIADMYTASNNISTADNKITLHEDLRLTIDNMCVPKEYEVEWG